MSAAFLSSASSTMRRARSSGCTIRLGRLGAATRQAIGARHGRALGLDPGVGHDRSSLRSARYRRMVADVGRDRIRDEVAERSAGRRPRRGAPTRTAGVAARRGTRRVPASRERASARNAGVGVRIAVARHDRDPGKLEDPRRGSCQVGSADERLGREDQRQVRGRRPRAGASSVSTVYDGPSRSSSIRLDREGRVARDRQLDHRAADGRGR